MSTIDSFGPTIKKIDSFIRELDPSIRLEAYHFLFAQEQRQLGHSATIPAKPKQTPKEARRRKN